MTFGILALGFPVSEVLQLLQPLGAHSLTFFPIYLPYLHAFLRWRLASWLWGSLFRRFCSFCSLWGLTVSLSSLYLPYLTAFLRWRLASWLWGSLFRRFCSFCSLWGLTVSLSSLYIFTIFMHSLGDVWHPGSGVPCFGGFAAFAAFGGLTEVLQVSQVLHPYLHAFLRWRLASWLWGSLFCSFCSLWGLTVSLSSLYIFTIFMHSLGDVWHPGSGVPYPTAFLRWRFASWLWGSLFRRFCSFCSLWGLTVSLSSLYIFPILMHSLGDVWHPGSGVPCFGGFAAFAAFGGSQSHFLPYISSLSSCIP